MIIDAKDLDFSALNEKIRQSENSCEIINCLGQRFIAAGMSDKKIDISGICGNACGAYLNGAEITIHANAQDAVGDTMNEGMIVVHGNIGDAAGYAMRGGEIYVSGNAGYRAGIHMKAYKDKMPVMVIGGNCGSFLGEYQAGGLIIVLGLTDENKPIVGNYACTGMHGGKMFLRSDCHNIIFPKQVNTTIADEAEMVGISPYIKKFCDLFGYDYEKIMQDSFTLITPDSKNPYKQMYVAN